MSTEIVIMVVSEEDSLYVILLKILEESGVNVGASYIFLSHSVNLTFVVQFNHLGEGNVDEGQVEDIGTVLLLNLSHLVLEPFNLRGFNTSPS
jgi:hypothetical protein